MMATASEQLNELYRGLVNKVDINLNSASGDILSLTFRSIHHGSRVLLTLPPKLINADGFRSIELKSDELLEFLKQGRMAMSTVGGPGFTLCLDRNSQLFIEA